MALIAPALLAADLACLGEALETIQAAGAPMVHVDVMDGHFTTDITVGQPVIHSLRKGTKLALDVHLLIERPERYVAQFVEAGADRVAVHAESTPQLHRVLDLIRARGAKVGLALNPATAVSSVIDVLGELDFLTILCADAGADLGQPGSKPPSPGRGAVQGDGRAAGAAAEVVLGRTLIAASLEKIRAAARTRAERSLGFAIAVEGGVNCENCVELVLAGADILVAGSAIFHSDNPKARLAEMIRLASEAEALNKV
jgi:ribulose-phosphate 3-epimerase